MEIDPACAPHQARLSPIYIEFVGALRPLDEEFDLSTERQRPRPNPSERSLHLIDAVENKFKGIGADAKFATIRVIERCDQEDQQPDQS